MSAYGKDLWLNKGNYAIRPDTIVKAVPFKKSNLKNTPELWQTVFRNMQLISAYDKKNKAARTFVKYSQTCKITTSMFPHLTIKGTYYGKTEKYIYFGVSEVTRKCKSPPKTQPSHFLVPLLLEMIQSLSSVISYIVSWWVIKPAGNRIKKKIRQYCFLKNSSTYFLISKRI